MILADGLARLVDHLAEDRQSKPVTPDRAVLISLQFAIRVTARDLGSVAQVVRAHA